MADPETFLADMPLITARWPDLAEARAVLAGAVIAIGNFDGVHLGHRAVLAEARQRAETQGRGCGLITFEPHPRSVFRPAEPLFRLTDAQMKARIVARFGFGRTVALDFEPGLSSLSAEDFIDHVLISGLDLGGVVAGPDFRFGKGRAGDVALLVRRMQAQGRIAAAIPVQELAGQHVSSSAIRAALGAGDVARANAMLGYRWCVTAKVQHGDKRGRLLGFPTANLHLDAACGLRHGIYAVRMAVEGTVHDGVASFGRRPTFDGGAPKLEVFLLNFAGDLYEKTVQVEFLNFIRPELRFDSVDDLIVQMRTDTAHARSALAVQTNLHSLLSE
jgi:riboflavin kinase / FMN adenylyltransferase